MISSRANTKITTGEEKQQRLERVWKVALYRSRKLARGAKMFRRRNPKSKNPPHVKDKKREREDRLDIEQRLNQIVKSVVCREAVSPQLMRTRTHLHIPTPYPPGPRKSNLIEIIFFSRRRPGLPLIRRCIRSSSSSADTSIFLGRCASGRSISGRSSFRLRCFQLLWEYFGKEIG